jgi:putative addiction module CopG family antidote
MNVSLPRELQKFVSAKVKSGQYASPKQVIEEAVAILRDRDMELQVLRASLEEASREIDRGGGIPLSEMTVKRVREGAIKRFGMPGQRTAS